MHMYEPFERLDNCLWFWALSKLIHFPVGHLPVILPSSSLAVGHLPVNLSTVFFGFILTMRLLPVILPVAHFLQLCFPPYLYTFVCGCFPVPWFHYQTLKMLSESFDGCFNLYTLVENTKLEVCLGQPWPSWWCFERSQSCSLQV